MGRQPFDVKAAAAEVRARYRRDQGLPENIEDPAIIDQLAELTEPRPHDTQAAS
jgi:hypothetical protein